MSNFKKISTIKDLSMKIKSHPLAINQLKYRRGLIYLRKKNYKKAINDFSDVIWRNKSEYVRGRRSLFIGKEKLYNTYLFRGFAYMLSGDDEKWAKDYTFLTKSDSKMEYVCFLFFSWAVVKGYKIKEAIRRYYKIRSYTKVLFQFENDLFNLLPIENIENLNESIKLIDLSLGIARKNKN